MLTPLRIGLVVFAVSSSILLDRTPVLSQISRPQAQTVTVRIDRPNGEDGGSGVLVKREGNRYTVLTNCHVVQTPLYPISGTYHLEINGDRYPVSITTPRCHPDGIDLALIEFESSRDYTIPPQRSETDLEQILNDSNIVLAGFSNVVTEESSNLRQPRTFHYIPGSWRSSRITEDGYNLQHTAAALNGMSGGPIFDSAGRLVAIHGETVVISPQVTAFAAIPLSYYTNWQNTTARIPNSPQRPTPQQSTRPTPTPATTSTPSQQRTFLGIPVEPFSYTTAEVSATGTVRTFTRQAEVGRYVEPRLTLPAGAVPLEMVAVEGGTFMMGQTEAEKQQLIKDAGQEFYDQYYSDEDPRHQVTVPDFFMGRYEVTQAQYEAVMGTNPTEGKARVWNGTEWTPDTQIPSKFLGANKPVVGVSWDDAQEFIQRLNRLTRKTYRLPTEAEWEYAARAGTTTPFSYGETITPEVVNYAGTVPYGNAPQGEYREVTIAVDDLPANPWGLQHIHGNVWEWIADEWYDSYSNKPQQLRQNGSLAWTQSSSGISPSINGVRGLRGGSWILNAWDTRSADRDRYNRDVRDLNSGFRVVLVP